MDLYTILADLGIAYEEIEHDPVYTVEQAQSIKSKISGIGCKNLFLTDQRRTKYLLVILEESKQADLQGKRLLFHPNINTKTLAISFDDTVRFIKYTNHIYKIF